MQLDIEAECKCAHPYLVQEGLPFPSEVQPCLITPSTNSNLVCLIFGTIEKLCTNCAFIAKKCHAELFNFYFLNI